MSLKGKRIIIVGADFESIKINEEPIVWYTITANIQNGTTSGDGQIAKEGTAQISIWADSGYLNPASVSVSGASFTYDAVTGYVTLSNPTGNVIINGSCSVAQSYPITVNVTNGTYTGPTSITQGTQANITITPASGYRVPSTISVTGASYTKSGNTITLSNPTSNVAINVVCEESTEIYLTENLANTQQSSGLVADGGGWFGVPNHALYTTFNIPEGYNAVQFELPPTHVDSIDAVAAYVSCYSAPSVSASNFLGRSIINGVEMIWDTVYLKTKEAVERIHVLPAGTNFIVVGTKDYNGSFTTIQGIKLKAIQLPTNDIEISNVDAYPVYLTGETLKNPTKITIRKADTTLYEVTSGFTISPSEGSTIVEGNNSITVTYNGLTKTYTVKGINEANMTIVHADISPSGITGEAYLVEETGSLRTSGTGVSGIGSVKSVIVPVSATTETIVYIVSSGAQETWIPGYLNCYNSNSLSTSSFLGRATFNNAPDTGTITWERNTIKEQKIAMYTLKAGTTHIAFANVAFNPVTAGNIASPTKVLKD